MCIISAFIVTYENPIHQVFFSPLTYLSMYFGHSLHVNKFILFNFIIYFLILIFYNIVISFLYIILAAVSCDYKLQWKEVQWILRYLRGTTSHALCFGGSDTILQGYVDADMAGDKDSRRSTTIKTAGGAPQCMCSL